MQIYLVGGAVRDSLLNLDVYDRDWVVVGATPKKMTDLGFRSVGKDFPVFLHPETQEEHALARQERKQGHGYSGFECQFSPDVTLEQDLLRRDLTINAMAMADDGTIIDPYNGQQDLDQRLLRHVSEAFVEDPLRVLRVARFAARFHHLGFTVADETVELMQTLTESGELQYLTAERIWKETERALSEVSPHVYFEVLKRCGALNVIFPEIEQLFGVPQTEIYHPEIDTGIHTLMVLEQIKTVGLEALKNNIIDTHQLNEIMFAGLTHDLGKGLTPKEEWPRHIGHEKRGLPLIKKIVNRLRVPNKHKELAMLVCEFHTHCHRAFELKPSTVHKLFNQLDVWRKPERFRQFLLSCEADAKGRTGFETTPYPQADYLLKGYEVCLEINPGEVAREGIKGPAIREEVEKRRIEKLKAYKTNYQAASH